MFRKVQRPVTSPLMERHSTFGLRKTPAGWSVEGKSGKALATPKTWVRAQGALTFVLFSSANPGVSVSGG